MGIKAGKINRNMGCIEIYNFVFFCLMKDRLIETWDVLKFYKGYFFLLQSKRLIETWDVLKLQKQSSFLCPFRINRNMGCIEIYLPQA